MTGDPHSITLGQIGDLLDGLGLGRDIADVASVRIEPCVVTVVRHRRNENGQTYMVDGELATETVKIAVTS